MEILTFVIAAGETKRFERAGRQLEVIAAPAAINIDFYDGSGSQTEEMRGALAGFYSLEPFSGFDVQNPATAAQLVTLMIASGQGGSRRAPGVVQIVDSARLLVAENRKFGNSATVAAPAAAQFAQAQMWNGSADKGVAIKGLWVFQSDIAGNVAVCSNNVILPAVSTAINVVSKRILAGGAPAMPAGIQTVRKSDAVGAGFGGVAGGISSLLGINVSAGAQQTRVPLDDAPIVIGPGAGLVLAHTIAVSGMQVYFEGEIFDWYG